MVPTRARSESLNKARNAPIFILDYPRIKSSVSLHEYALLALELINQKQQGELLHAFNEVCDLGIEPRGDIQEQGR